MIFEQKVSQLAPVSFHLSSVAVGILMFIGLVVLAIAIVDYFIGIQRRKLKKLEEDYFRILKYNHFLLEQIGQQPPSLFGFPQHFNGFQANGALVERVEKADEPVSLSPESRPLGSLRGSGLARYELLDNSYPSQFKEQEKTVVSKPSDVTIGTFLCRNKGAATKKHEPRELIHSNVA